MKPAMKKERDQIIQLLWDAQDNAAQEDAPEVLTAARITVLRLEIFLSELNQADEPGETGKTYKFLGDAYYALAAKKDQELIAKARKMYVEAEGWLELAGDELTLAKLNFNLGNACRRLGGGYDRANMEEARQRYNNALKFFTATQPDAVPTVLESLQDLEIALRALDMFEVSARGKQRSEALMAQLAENPSPEFMQAVQDEIDQMGTDADKDAWKMIELLRGAQDVTSSVETEGNIQSLMGLVNQGALAEELESQKVDNDLFGRAYAMLNQSVTSGEATKEEADDLRAILEQFQGIATRPAETPAELNTQYAEMKEFADQYKKASKPTKSRARKKGKR